MTGSPEPGEVVWLDYQPGSDADEPWRRPALVLSPAEYNSKIGLALVCPITSHALGNPFEHELPEGLEVSGVILADQVECIDWRARKAQVACRVSPALLKKVAADISLLLPETGR